MNPLLTFDLSRSAREYSRELEEPESVQRKRYINKLLGSASANMQKSKRAYAKKINKMYRKGIFAGWRKTYNPEESGLCHEKELLRQEGITQVNETIGSLKNMLDISCLGTQKNEAELKLLDENSFKRKECLHRIETQIRENHDALEKEKANQEQFLKEFDGYSPIPTIYDNRYSYWVIAFIIYGFELGLTFDIFEKIGDTNQLLNAIGAFTFPLAFAVSAIAGAKDLQKKNWIMGIGWVLFGLCTCAIAIYLRITYSEQNPTTSILIVIFYLFSLLLAISKTKNFRWFKNQRAISKLSKQNQKLIRKRENIKAHLYEANSDSIEDKEVLHQQLSNAIEAYRKEMNDLFLLGCRTFNLGYEKRLRIPFIKMIRQTFPEDKPLFEGLKEEIVGHKSNGQYKGPRFATAPCIVLLTISLLSCSAPKQELTVLIDKTHPHHEVTTKSLASYISNSVLEMKGDIPRDECHLTIGEIINRRISKEKTIDLPSGKIGPLEITKKRKAVIEDFRVRMDSLISEEMMGVQDFKTSYVHQNITYHLNRMARRDENTKASMVVVSDMIMHTPELSFYKEHEVFQDYEALAKRLQTLMPLEDYSGISIHIFYLPSDPKSDYLFSEALKFWTWLYEKQNAEVIYKSSV